MRTVTGLIALLAISAGETMAECSPSADRQAEMKAKVELVQSLSPDSFERRAALEELHVLARDRAGCEATVTYRGHAVPPAADISMTANQKERAAILTTLQTEPLQPDEREESLARLLDLTKEQVKRREEEKRRSVEADQLAGFMSSPCLAIAKEGQVTFYEDWSSGKIEDWKYAEKCHDDNFQVVRDPMKPTNAVLRVYNHQTSCGTAAGRAVSRNELYVPAVARNGEPLYWSQRIFIPDWPDTGTMPQSKWATIMQMASGPWNGRYPTDFKLQLHGGGKLKFNGPGGGEWQIRRGDWMTVEVFIVREQGQGGVTQVLINGQQVVNYRGNTTDTNITAVMRTGIYTDLGASSEPLTLLFDDTIIATGQAFARCADTTEASSEQ